VRVSGPQPALSVIVPAHQAENVIARSLAALRASDLPRENWELIVVDDASTDTTAQVAGRYADRVLRIRGVAGGPAAARNRGAEAARGEVLVFVDADVCVHSDALGRFAELFAQHPEFHAVFGLYDTAPSAAGLVSQYRNLLHHYVHARNAGEAETFWAGCGAVRKCAFSRVGGFDHQRYSRPQIEDIELGYRLRAAGYRILLSSRIQGTHLKRWSVGSLVVTDLFDRAIPWMRLLLRPGHASRRPTLNVRPMERACTALTGAGVAAIGGAVVLRSAILGYAGVLSLTAVILANAPLLGWFARQRGWRFAAKTIPLRIVYYLISGTGVGIAWVQHLLAVEPARKGRATLNASEFAGD